MKYYIQNVGFSGDCLRWWRPNGHGYTLNLDEAWRVSKEKAEEICRTRPKEDIPRPAAEVDQAAHRHVNCEAVRNKPWWSQS